MFWIIVAVIFLIGATIVFKNRPNKGMVGPVNPPYRKTGRLFSPAERSFLGVLNQAVGKNARIFGKVIHLNPTILS